MRSNLLWRLPLKISLSWHVRERGAHFSTAATLWAGDRVADCVNFPGWSRLRALNVRRRHLGLVPVGIFKAEELVLERGENGGGDDHQGNGCARD